MMADVNALSIKKKKTKKKTKTVIYASCLLY